jgi:hypothetical protein
MKSVLPSNVLKYVNLSEDGRWLFASGKFTGKPVPRFGAHNPSGSLYFLHGGYAPSEYYTPALQAKRSANGDPEAVDVSLLALAQRDLDVFDKMQDYGALSVMRDHSMREAVQRLVHRTGAEPSLIVPIVAELFDVGPRVVQRALGASAEIRSVSKAYKSDPRWNHLRVMVQRAKSGAYAKDVVRNPNTPASYGGFKAESLLIKHGNELLFPEACPVTGLTLIYDRFNNPTDLRMAHIARKDNTKPMSDDNVQVVSLKARKMLETRAGKKGAID